MPYKNDMGHAVNTMTGYGLDDRRSYSKNWQELFLSPPKCPDRSDAHSPMGTGVLSPGAKRPGRRTDH